MFTPSWHWHMLTFRTYVFERPQEVQRSGLIIILNMQHLPRSVYYYARMGLKTDCRAILVAGIHVVKVDENFSGNSGNIKEQITKRSHSIQSNQVYVQHLARTRKTSVEMSPAYATQRHDSDRLVVMAYRDRESRRGGHTERGVQCREQQDWEY